MDDQMTTNKIDTIVSDVIDDILKDDVYGQTDGKKQEHITAGEQNEFLPQASSLSKIKACISTLNAFADLYRGTPVAARLISLRDIAYGISQDKELSQDEHVAERVVLTTVFFLDLTVVKNITSERGPGKGEYYREYWIDLPKREDSGKKNEVDLELKTLSVQQYIQTVSTDFFLEKISGKKYYHEVLSVQEAIDQLDKGKISTLYIPYPLTYDDLKRIDEAVQRNTGDKFHRPNVICISKIDSLSTGVFLLGESGTTKAQYALGSGINGIYPRADLSRQDVWISYLNKGFPVLRQEESQPLEDKNNIDNLIDRLEHFFDYDLEIKDKANKYLRRLYRRNKLVSKMEYDPELIERWKERTRRHLKINFGNNEAEVVLTGSGVLANESAIAGVFRVMGKKDLKVYVNTNGWYFENLEGELLDSDLYYTNPDEANVIFVNWEPMHPDAPKKGELPYTEERDNAIDTIYRRAREAELIGSDEQFVLVVDKTTNLLLLPRKDRPKNLTIIEAASLTKHQDGGTNYFAGAIFIYGDDKFKDAVKEEVNRYGAEASPSQIVNFPRPTRAYIEKFAERGKELGRKFAQMLEDAQQDLPKSLRIYLQPWTYYAYLVPPVEGLVDIYLNMTGKEEVDSASYTEFEKFVEDYILGGYFKDKLLEEEGMPPFIDTFNLEKLPSLFIGNAGFPIEAKTKAGRKFFKGGVVRFSYGLGDQDKIEEDMQMAADFIAKIYKERIAPIYNIHH